MSREVKWTKKALSELKEWQGSNKKTILKIMELIKDIDAYRCCRLFRLRLFFHCR